MLQQFAKPEIQNSLKNSNDSLICFMAIFVCVFWLRNNFLTVYCLISRVPDPALRLESPCLSKCTGMGPRDGRAACFPPQYRHWPHAKLLFSPRDTVAATAATSASIGTTATAIWVLTLDDALGTHGTQDCLGYMHARRPGQLLSHSLWQCWAHTHANCSLMYLHCSKSPCSIVTCDTCGLQNTSSKIKSLRFQAVYSWAWNQGWGPFWERSLAWLHKSFGKKRWGV